MKKYDEYIIGDVHGCFYTLKKLLKKLPSDAKVIYTGDLCDKGNYTKEVIQLIKNNKNFKAIKGNHDHMMIEYSYNILKGGKKNLWASSEMFGGYKTLESYKNEENLLFEHVEWLKTLPHYIEIDNYFITHGYALPYYKRKDDKNFQKILFLNRIDQKKHKEDWEDFSNYNIINIYGHCDFDEVRIEEKSYGIDTGCVYSRKLTALKLGTMEIIEEKIDKRDIS